MAPTKRAPVVKAVCGCSSQTLNGTEGKRKTSFLLNNFPCHVFACLINKFEKHPLL